MASKRNQRRKACIGKIQYPTFETAMTAAMRVQRQLNDKVRPYRCPFGTHFHNGHQPKKVRQAIEQRRGY
jgi:hypothetical protein